MKREDSPDVDAAVADIIADVRARGDQAVIDLTATFDRLELTPERSRIPTAPRWNWPQIASTPITPAKCLRISVGRMRPGPIWAGAGRPFRRRVYMCRVGWRAIRLRF